jgi:hypothetical protein
VDKAPVLPISIWLKIEQSAQSIAAYAAEPALHGLSTGCSTVFVRKPNAWV